jgi:heterodisulfide reductase subunit A-like polyferredoxin
MNLVVKNSIKPKTVETRNFASLQNHAVVVGGSIAGMLAARVLADHFTSLTLPAPKGAGILKEPPSL